MDRLIYPIICCNPTKRKQSKGLCVVYGLTSASYLRGEELGESSCRPRGETSLGVGERSLRLRPSAVSPLEGVLRGDGLLWGDALLRGDTLLRGDRLLRGDGLLRDLGLFRAGEALINTRNCTLITQW